MKREEKIANDYFISEGFSKILYEPDGNIPPDFLLNDKIAVEVRRLNQHYNRLGTLTPFEKLQFKLIHSIEKLLNSFEASKIDSSAFLSIIYNRPLKVDKKLISDINDILHDHITFIKEPREYNVRENLNIRITPTNLNLSHLYELGIQSDHDSGGFVVSETYKNLNIIIEEKELKVKPYFKKYTEWWLVLIDYIGYGLRELDIKQLKSLTIKSNSFSKIILLSPNDYKSCIILDKFAKN